MACFCMSPWLAWLAELHEQAISCEDQKAKEGQCSTSCDIQRFAQWIPRVIRRKDGSWHLGEFEKPWVMIILLFFLEWLLLILCVLGERKIRLESDSKDDAEKNLQAEMA